MSEGERVIHGMPFEEWRKEIRKTRSQTWTKEGLKSLGLAPLLTPIRIGSVVPGCEYFDCARMNRGQRIAMFKTDEGKGRCNNCAVVEATKKRLGIEDGD